MPRVRAARPAGLAAFRSGDLVSRLVGDIDSLADRWLHVLLRHVVAGAAGTGTVVVMALLVPGAGALAGVTLLAVATAAPWLAGLVARRAETQIAPYRGKLTATGNGELTGLRIFPHRGGVHPARAHSRLDRRRAVRQ